MVTWYQTVIEVSLSMGSRVWEAGQHASMFSVRVFTRDKLISCRDTLELSAELRMLTVSMRRDTAPETQNTLVR